jgi:DNA-directed RNA polymerase specialized sigma24 family protein
VVHETYVQAFAHLDDFRGDSSLATWLSRIAMNLAVGRLRRQRPGGRMDDVAAGRARGPDHPFSPHGHVGGSGKVDSATRRFHPNMKATLVVEP